MKKIVSLVLVALLMACSVASAEGIDIASMSLEELVELHKLVDAEIDARIGCKQNLIPSGVYVAGDSIKQGGYIISCDEEYYGVNVATFASKEIYEQAMAEQNESLITFQNYLSKNESAFVKIEYGMVLLLSGTAIIEDADADWMP